MNLECIKRGASNSRSPSLSGGHLVDGVPPAYKLCGYKPQKNAENPQPHPLGDIVAPAKPMTATPSSSPRIGLTTLISQSGSGHGRPLRS